MNALTLLGLFLATIVAVSCGSHHHHHRVNQHANLTLQNFHNNSMVVATSQTVKVQHHRIPEKIRTQLAKHTKGTKMARHFELPEEMQQRLKANELKFLKSKAATGGSTSTIPLENWYDYLLIANITVGTPPQTVRVAFSFWDEDLYVIGADAVENDGDYDSGSWSWSSSSSSEDSSSNSSSSSSSSSDAEIVADYGKSTKNTYNASQSSTAVPQNGNFSADNGYVTGSLVNDIVNLGGLDLNMTLGDADVYDWWVGYLPIDGVLGLSPSASVNGIPNVLQQISSQLAQPLVVLNTNRDFQEYNDGVSDSTEVNEITFGTDNVDGCDTNWSWTTLGDVGNDSWGAVNATSISVAPGADGCAKSVNASHPVYLINWFEPIYTSYQVRELFVQASGAQYNDTSGWYQTPCDQVAQGKNVNLNLEDGGAITLGPNDYHVEYDGVCYLFVLGLIDERDPQNAGFAIYLGQQFANNHCVAYNIAENLLGTSNKV